MDLACYACGWRGRGTPFDHDCHRCGEPLWTMSSRDPPSMVEGGGMVRFAAFMDPPFEGGPTMGAGGTPMVEVDPEESGARVLVKDEGENPTGSFKDRGSTLGAQVAERLGLGLVTVSHGNMALSTAVYGAARGVPTVAVVPRDLPRERLELLLRHGTRVVVVEDDYGKIFQRVLLLAPRLGLLPLVSDHPLRVEGQKTLALEVWDGLGRRPPDRIFLPAGSGGLASAVWKAFTELHQWNLASTIPRIHLAQAAAVAPIAGAFKRGERTVAAVGEVATVAYSIANGRPPSGRRALEAVRRTGGTVEAVDDQEILAAQGWLASRGIVAEPAGAAALAGLRAWRQRRGPPRDETLVVVVSGRGHPNVPPRGEGVVEEASPAHLERALARGRSP